MNLQRSKTWLTGGLMFYLGCSSQPLPPPSGPPPEPPPQPSPSVSPTSGSGASVDAGSNTAQSDATSGALVDAAPSPLDALIRACEAGEEQGCLDAADAVVADQHGALEPQRAVLDRLSRACAGGNVPGCNGTMIVLVNGPAALRDPVRARSIATEQCSPANPAACGFLGTMMEDGVGGPSDPRGAIPYYVRGCEGDNTLACNNLGATYLEGVLVPRDMERARGLFQRACDRGYRLACHTLAERFAGNAANPRAAAAPSWSTTIGSSTINGTQFETVRGTCNMFEVLAALTAVSHGARRCSHGHEPARVTFTVASGEVTAARDASDNSGGRCLTRAVRHANFGSLTCTLELGVRR